MVRLQSSLLSSTLLFLPSIHAFSPSSPGINVWSENRSSNRGRQLSHVLFETRETNPDTNDSAFQEQADETPTTRTSTKTSETSFRFQVTRPAIHWTVPGYKVGWRDEDGNWFDEDGPRNGPPQNYWRQMSDEREYNRDMAAVTSILTEFNVEEAITELEKRCGARRPALSRKRLGTWAPLLLAGKRVFYNDSPADEEGAMEVPFTVDVYRKEGRKFAERTYYGLFDAKLENGERLMVETNTGSVHAEFTLDESNDPFVVDMVNVNFGVDGEEMQTPLSLGRITYISDYLLIQRDGEGALDFWLRCDDSYLGVVEE